AARVELVSYEKTGGGYTTIVVRGDVAAVRAACDAAQTAAGRVGDVVAVHVIARPHDQVDAVMPLGRTPAPQGKQEGPARAMRLARVVGTVVSTRKEDSIKGIKLLVVRPLDEEGKETGNAVVSADAVGAGPDEVVLIAAGSSARQTTVTDKRPIDSVILAIVDSWSVGDTLKYKK